MDQKATSQQANAQQEFESDLWRAIKADRTVMLGLVDDREARVRPMTAMLEGERGGPVWFFTAIDNPLVAALADGPAPAAAQFASKGHDLFACIHGQLALDNDRAAIDRLWNPFVAAWYEGGKSDPKLALLRFSVERAEVWKDASSIVAGIKILLGFDPKREYRDKKADIALH